jgi:nitrile hydratase
MDGVHDLGGGDGFGAVVVEPDEPPYHQPWEGRTHGMMLTLIVSGGITGGLRRAVEEIPPAQYLATSYYEKRLLALEALLIRAGHLQPGELDAAVAASRVPVRRDSPELAALLRTLLRPFPVVLPAGSPPRYAPGDRVRVRRMRPAGHHRCPRYVRGAVGTVARVYPAAPLPDDGSDHAVTPYYAVDFRGPALWGEQSEPGTSVVVDLWEQYLEDATP